MLKLLRSLFGGAAPAPAPGDPWTELETLLAPTAPWSDDHASRVIRALRRLAPSPDDLTRLAPLFKNWYAHHPIEVVWRADYDLVARDPLHVEIDAAAATPEDPTLLPWARLLRSLHVVDGGPGLFHHGLSARDLLDVLCDPAAPTVEVFRAPHMVDFRDSDLDAIVDHLAHHPTMQDLRHLALGVSGFAPRHLRRLCASGRAAQLVSLDVCERLLDHDDDDVLTTLTALGDLRALEHLNMYNNIRTAEHMRALAGHEFPKLTHLSIGPAAVDDAFIAALCTDHAFPALRALAITPCPPALARWLDARKISRSLR